MLASGLAEEGRGEAEEIFHVVLYITSSHGGLGEKGGKGKGEGKEDFRALQSSDVRISVSPF